MHTLASIYANARLTVSLVVVDRQAVQDLVNSATLRSAPAVARKQVAVRKQRKKRIEKKAVPPKARIEKKAVLTEPERQAAAASDSAAQRTYSEEYAVFGLGGTKGFTKAFDRVIVLHTPASSSVVKPCSAPQ